jgi:hypothetical protein
MNYMNNNENYNNYIQNVDTFFKLYELKLTT